MFINRWSLSLIFLLSLPLHAAAQGFDGPDPATLLDDEAQAARNSALFQRVEDPSAELGAAIQARRLEIEGLLNSLAGPVQVNARLIRKYNAQMQKFQRLSESNAPAQNLLLVNYERAVRARDEALARRTRRDLERLRQRMKRDFDRIHRELKRIETRANRANR